MKSLTEETIFVNGYSVIGAANGVINLDLVTAIFSPNDDGKTVSSEMAVTVRLRMDSVCARTIHTALGDWLQKMEAAADAAITAGRASKGLAGPEAGEKTH
jgi:hypothetical protein